MGRYSKLERRIKAYADAQTPDLFNRLSEWEAKSDPATIIPFPAAGRGKAAKFIGMAACFVLLCGGLVTYLGLADKGMERVEQDSAVYVTTSEAGSAKETDEDMFLFADEEAAEEVVEEEAVGEDALEATEPESLAPQADTVFTTDSGASDAEIMQTESDLDNAAPAGKEETANQVPALVEELPAEDEVIEEAAPAEPKSQKSLQKGSGSLVLHAAPKEDAVGEVEELDEAMEEDTDSGATGSDSVTLEKISVEEQAAEAAGPAEIGIFYDSTRSISTKERVMEETSLLNASWAFSDVTPFAVQSADGVSDEEEQAVSYLPVRKEKPDPAKELQTVLGAIGVQFLAPSWTPEGIELTQACLVSGEEPNDPKAGILVYASDEESEAGAQTAYTQQLTGDGFTITVQMQEPNGEFTAPVPEHILDLGGGLKIFLEEFSVSEEENGTECRWRAVFARNGFRYEVDAVGIDREPFLKMLQSIFPKTNS